MATKQPDNNLIESLSVSSNLSGFESKFRKGVLYGLFSYCMFAMTIVSGKILQRMHPTSFNTLFFIAVRSFSIYIVSHIGLLKSKVSLMEIADLKLKWLFLLRVSCNFIAFYSIILMLDYFRIGTATCISSTHPLFVLLFSTCILGTKIHFRYLVGFVLSLTGTYIIVNREDTAQSNSTNKNLLIGSFLGFLHTTCVGFKFTINKLLVEAKVDNNLNSAWVGITNCFFAAIGVWLSGDYSHFFDFNFVLLSLFNGVIFYSAYLSLNISFRYISATAATALSYMNTVFGTVFGILLFGETLFWTDFVGFFFIMSFNVYHCLNPIKD